jgi:hypothetical protein
MVNLNLLYRLGVLILQKQDLMKRCLVAIYNSEEENYHTYATNIQKEILE